MISQEKALEYKQVAALVCMDIDTIAESALRNDMTFEWLKMLVTSLKDNKDCIIANKKIREKRYYDVLVSLGIGESHDSVEAVAVGDGADQ